MSDVLIVLVLAACATAVLAARSVSSAERARVRIPVDRRRVRGRMQEAALADHRRSVRSQGRAVDRAGRAVAYGRGWLSTRHSLPIEMAMVIGVYAAYEATRGLVAGDAHVALRHAHDVVSLERSLHVFVEGHVQRAAQAVPGLIGTLGFAYLTLHLTVTGALLLWLHRRRPAVYPLVRTTLLLASALAVVGYVVFPTAPPRLSGVGIADTVSRGHVNLNTGLVSSFYNPFAAVPSMHVGYALIVSVSLARYARHVVARLAGIAYPPFVLFVIVATGNHFLADAAAGAAVAAVALLGARLLATPQSNRGVPQPQHRAWTATSNARAQAAAAEHRAA
jgi:hypothetical protein